MHGGERGAFVLMELPRARAGRCGALANETASQLRELNHAEVARLDVPDVIRGFQVAAFTLLVQRYEGEDECAVETLLLRRDSGSFAPIVFWFVEARKAFSSDGDEPAYRLFSEWMRRSLEKCGLDRELANGVAPSAWVVLQDRTGEPLDHRVSEGMISTSGYSELSERPRSAQKPECAKNAALLFQRFIREIVDPEARFGQKVAELGLP
jgi:hypothetical protein